MAAAAAALSFADEPVADVKVAEFSGNAAVTWGVDLDTQKTGFKNEESATLKVNISNEGTKKTEGEGIWAEIEIKGKQLYVKNGGADTGNLKGKVGNDYTNDAGAWKWTSDNASFDGSGGASVEKAQLHFGPVYVGIKSGDTVLGEFNGANAVNSSKLGVSNTYDDAEGHKQGIVAGFSNDLFAIDVDFRSHPISGNYYTNDYGVAGEATLKFIPGLEIKAGADYQIRYNDADSNKLGVGASEKYTLALGDKFKLIEGVGFNMGKVVTNSATPIMNLAAGVVFAWGDEADANAGVPYLDGDYAKKVTPGVGVAAAINDIANDARTIVIQPSFYSGDIIPNLKVGVLGQIGISTVSGNDAVFGVAGGLKYDLKATDALTISPYAGARFVKNETWATTAKLFDDTFTNETTDNGNKKDLQGAGNNKLNVKIGADVSGLINNTTFSAWWQSRNLLNEDADKTTNGQVGTINVSCKIAL